MSSVDWSRFISISWDERQRESSVVRVAGAKVPADPPAVPSRRARWEVSSTYPRIFAAAYRFSLDTVAVNRGLREQRGRTLVARHLAAYLAELYGPRVSVAARKGRVPKLLRLG